MRCWANIRLMLGQRRGLWANVKSEHTYGVTISYLLGLYLPLMALAFIYFYNSYFLCGNMCSLRGNWRNSIRLKAANTKPWANVGLILCQWWLNIGLTPNVRWECHCASRIPEGSFCRDPQMEAPLIRTWIGIYHKILRASEGPTRTLYVLDDLGNHDPRKY